MLWTKIKKKKWETNNIWYSITIIILQKLPYTIAARLPRFSTAKPSKIWFFYCIKKKKKFLKLNLLPKNKFQWIVSVGCMKRRWELFADGWVVRSLEFDSGRGSRCVHHRRRCQRDNEPGQLWQGSIGVHVVRRYTSADPQVQPAGEHRLGGNADIDTADLNPGTWRPRCRKEPLRRQRRLQEWLWHGGKSLPFVLFSFYIHLSRLHFIAAYSTYRVFHNLWNLFQE